MADVPKPTNVPLPTTLPPTTMEMGNMSFFKLSNGQMLSVSNAAVTGTTATGMPSATQVNTYFTQQYASKSLPDLQAMLATRKPGDVDYAVLSNLVNSDQYVQKATVAYSAMSTANLSTVTASLTNATDKALATSALEQKYKSQDANISIAQAYSLYSNPGTSSSEKSALASLYPDVNATFAPVTITVTPPTTHKHSSCPKYSLGCLGFDDLNVGNGDAPLGLRITAGILSGVVTAAATVAVSGPFLPVEDAPLVAAPGLLRI